MTLIELLIAICFVTPFASAIEVAHHSKVGVGGYALAIALGLPLAFGAASLMYKAFARVATAMPSPLGWKGKLYSSFLLMLTLLWIVLATLFTEWVVSAAVSLLA